MHRRISAALVVLTLSPAGAIAATGGAGSHAGSGHGSGSAPKASAPRQADRKGADTVLAEVGGRVVTAAELDARLAIPTSAMHARDSDEKRAAARSALQEEIRNRLALLEFERRGYGKDPRYVNPLRIHQDEILADAFVRAKYQHFEPTEEELKARLPTSWTKVKLSAIYFQDRETAEAARPEIVANAGRFEEMAAKHSTLKSQKPHGGEYLLRGSGMFSPADEEALFSLKQGAISPVIDLQIMFAVYRVEDRKEIPEEERAQMRQEIASSLREKKIGEHLAEIAKGHVYETRLAALQQAIEDMLALRNGNDRVVAVLDGDQITFGDLRNAQARPPEAFYTSISVGGLVTAYQTYLDRVMVTRTIAAEARKEGFKAPQPKGGDPMVWTIATRRLGAAVFKDISVTEKEVRAYYDANLPMFSRAEMYTLQKMEFASREIAEMARKRVVDDPSLFPRVREAMSEEVFEDRHGGGKAFREEFTNRPAAYRDAIRATPVGKVTPVVELDGRFLVLRVDDVTKGYVFPYDQVRWEIAKRLLGAKQSPVLTAFIDGLYAGTNVVVHQDRVEAYLKEVR